MSTTFEYRPSLDGIRAIAVLSVLVYHLNADWLPGGYLGVDIFFVMSGYLITSLLILEHQRDGRISLTGFWARRVRRLLPALAAMITGVAVYYAVFAGELELIGLRGDLLSALFYAANWRFISSGQSYFEQYVAVSPVRHTWSLAIEEQFYVVWPLVAMVTLRWRRSRFVVFVALLASISVGLMGYLYDAADPSRAYFGSGARVHQILVGVLLAATLSGALAEQARRFGRVLLPGAVLVLGSALVWLHDEAPLYYSGGSFVIAVAVAIVIAGLEGGHPFRSPLSWSPMVQIGLVSYGLYLWHWPVIQIITARWGPTTELKYAVLAAAVSTVVTLASYVLIERPIRKRTTLFGASVTPRFLLLGVPVVSAATLAVVMVTTDSAVQPDWAAGGTAPAILQNIDENGAGDSAESDALPMVAVVGDSVSVSLLPGFRQLADANALILLEAATPACPVGYQPLFNELGEISPYAEACEQGVRPGHDAVVAAEPDLVVWHDLQSVLARRAESGEILLPGTPEWSKALRAEWRLVLDRFLHADIEVLLVLPPLRSADEFGGCESSVRPGRCATIQAQDAIIRAVTFEFWDDVASMPGVHTVDLDDLVCPGGNPCPELVDGVALRAQESDQTHFTEVGALWLVPKLLQGTAGQAG
jgi:peptidoglycan/LPS O-acetylase OafA/YrhL